MSNDKSLRDDVAELTEAVNALRDREVADTLRDLRAEVEKLRAERGASHCHGCICSHVHWYPNTWTYPGTVTYPQYMTTTIGTGTTVAGSGYVSTAGNTLGLVN